MQWITKSLEETKARAAEWVTSLGDLIPKSAMIVGLQGDLGSGKTSFVQGVARALGVEEHVVSLCHESVDAVVLNDVDVHWRQVADCENRFAVVLKQLFDFGIADQVQSLRRREGVCTNQRKTSKRDDCGQTA